LIDICHRDAAGFAMTQPVSSSGFPRGERLFVPFEANQGRRVNVIGGYFLSRPPEKAGRFVFETAAKLPQSKAKKRRKSLEERAQAPGVTAEDVGVIDAEFFLAFVWKLAGRPEGAGSGWKRERPSVIPLDNYSVHTSERVKAEQKAWEEADIHLFYLPSYRPELSEIEPVWQDIKYRELTQRSFHSLGDLLTQVKDALLRKSVQLLTTHQTAPYTDYFLRRAA
jgi:hypothetical protein